MLRDVTSRLRLARQSVLRYLPPVAFVTVIGVAGVALERVVGVDDPTPPPAGDGTTVDDIGDAARRAIRGITDRVGDLERAVDDAGVEPHGLEAELASLRTVLGEIELGSDPAAARLERRIHDLEQDLRALDDATPDP